MELIEKYINSFCKGNKGKYFEDLKEEIRNHLLEATNYFKSQGYDNDEAQRKAINDFEEENGYSNNLYFELTKDIDCLNKKIKNIINVTNIIHKIFKYLSIFCILISLVLYFLYKSNLILNNQLFTWNVIETDINHRMKEIALYTDIDNINMYKEKIDNIMKSEEIFKEVKNFRIYKNERDSYADKVSNVIYGDTSNNLKSCYSLIDQVKGFNDKYWYYRAEIDTSPMTKIATIITDIFFYITPISVIICLFIGFYLKRLNKLNYNINS